MGLIENEKYGTSFFDCIEEYFYTRRNNQGRGNGK